MPAAPEPIERRTFDAATLVAEHPPVLRHTNKLVVYSIACPEDCTHAGTIGYTRWSALGLPASIDPAAAVDRAEPRPTIFDYRPAVSDDAIEWYVNFADPYLFYAYGSGLFAQDEMQSAEHPALGALVEALHAEGHRGLTEDDSGPTPVLVTGVERRVVVAIDRNEAEGRPRGLYGNEFSAASVDTIRKATRRIKPPTISNLIALAAPSYGVGRYDRATIERILVTACTGFSAAVAESALIRPGAGAVIHTGYWGCGVFGGDRVMMAMLQVIAAAMADVRSLVFHTVSEEGAEPFREAVRLVREQVASDGPIGPDELLERIEALGLEWGMSDGR